MMPIVSVLRRITHTVVTGVATVVLLHSAPTWASELKVERLWQFAHQPGVPGQKSEIVATTIARTRCGSRA